MLKTATHFTIKKKIAQIGKNDFWIFLKIQCYLLKIE